MESEKPVVAGPTDWHAAWERGWAAWVAVNARCRVLIGLALAPLWIFPVVLWWVGVEHWRWDLGMADSLRDADFAAWLAKSSHVQAMRWIVAHSASTVAFGALASLGAMLSFARARPAMAVVTLALLVSVWGLCLYLPMSSAPLDGALIGGG